MHHAFSDLTVDTRDKFDKVFHEILKKQAPLKRKLLKHAPYVQKVVEKAIMKRAFIEKESA